MSHVLCNKLTDAKEFCLSIRCWDIWACISREDIQSHHRDLLCCIIATCLDFKTCFSIKEQGYKSFEGRVIVMLLWHIYSSLLNSNTDSINDSIWSEIRMFQVKYLVKNVLSWSFSVKNNNNLDLFMWIVNILLWILNENIFHLAYDVISLVAWTTWSFLYLWLWKKVC